MGNLHLMRRFLQLKGVDDVVLMEIQDIYSGKRGKRRGEVDEEEIELVGNEETGSPARMNGTRAQTTVMLTIGERLHSQDDLF